MRKKTLLVLTIIACAGNFFSFGQNLVPNPSFEEFEICPGGYSEAVHEFRVNGWKSATFGTPDHFHSCSNGEADVPHNWAGVSDAYNGNGYAGIYMYMDNGIEYREYLQCKLLEPLIKDSVYNIEFHYKLSTYSRYSIDRIGLLLSDSLISKKHDRVLRIKPTFSVVKDSALTITTGLWETASIRYKASGTENYLMIGNFFDNGSTHVYKIQFRPTAQEMLAMGSYYYIDDVKVIPQYILDQAIQIPLPEFSLTETELNTTYVLKNIQFQFNSYRLVSPSFQELDQVADYLMRFPKVKVQLSGHTDDRGGDEYNLRLSRNRARSAGGYLESLGINPKRIETFGYGKNKPLVESISEEARRVNRRVEVKFIE